MLKNNFFKIWLPLRKCTEETGCRNRKERYLNFISKPFVYIFLPFTCIIHFDVSRSFVSDGIKNFFCLSLYNVLSQQNKSVEIKVKVSHLKYFLMSRYSEIIFSSTVL